MQSDHLLANNAYARHCSLTDTLASNERRRRQANQIHNQPDTRCSTGLLRVRRSRNSGVPVQRPDCSALFTLKRLAKRRCPFAYCSAARQNASIRVILRLNGRNIKRCDPHCEAEGKHYSSKSVTNPSGDGRCVWDLHFFRLVVGVTKSTKKCISAVPMVASSFTTTFESAR